MAASSASFGHAKHLIVISLALRHLFHLSSVSHNIYSDTLSDAEKRAKVRLPGAALHSRTYGAIYDPVRAGSLSRFIPPCNLPSTTSSSGCLASPACTAHVRARCPGPGHLLLPEPAHIPLQTASVRCSSVSLCRTSYHLPEHLSSHRAGAAVDQLPSGHLKSASTSALSAGINLVSNFLQGLLGLEYHGVRIISCINALLTLLILCLELSSFLYCLVDISLRHVGA